MAKVGRPRVSTQQGARPPVNEIGVADPLNYGVTFDPAKGNLATWRMWTDQLEWVPELRWPSSIPVFDQMRTDSQLAALTTAVMYGITQLRFIIDGNGARPELIKEVSQDLNLPVKGDDGNPQGRMKKRFTHHKFISQALLAILYGHMYFEQVGEIVDGKWRLRKMQPRMPHWIQAINVADDGGLVSIRQWAGKWQQNGIPLYGPFAPEIPVDHLTAFIFQQEGFSWVGRSMLRDCYKDWLVKDRLVRVEAINHERAGGVPYANAPQGATPAEIEDLDQLMRNFRIGETAGAAVPFGSEIKIARGTGSDVGKTITRLDESMARRFLLQLMNLAQGGSHVGSYALSENFEDTFLVGQRAITQWYVDVVNEHIVEDIADWNYGEDEEFVPKLTWERTSEDSLGTEQLATLVQRGVILVDDEIENAIRYKYQLPKRGKPREDSIVTPGGPRQPTLEQALKNPVLTEDVQTGQGGNPEDPGVQAGAPSSVTPGSTRASFLERFRRKPDVQAKQDAPSLVTVSNVEILHAGVEYNLSTGPTTFTPEDLRDAVTAANEDPSIPNPRLKIGHIDPRYNNEGEFDGTPSFGLATNLRLSDNGMAVYADYVGVPRWLADIMPTAYPSRSVEGYWNVESQMGKKWRFCLSACSLLGVVWPGVTVLEDLPQYYGATMPEGVQVVPVLATGGDPEVKLPFGKKEGATAASANLDDVRRAFYGEYVDGEKFWWWIQAIVVDPNQLVVEDDEDGQLYIIPFEANDAGEISFGEATEVKIQYVPDTARKAAAASIGQALTAGKSVAASWSTRAESRPANASGGAMDPKEIRKRLNLPEDASDEQVRDTIKELNEATGHAGDPGGDGLGGNAVSGTAVTPVGTGTPTPGVPVTPEGATAEDDPDNVARASKGNGVKVPEGFVLLDKETLESLKVGASAGLEERKERQKGDRERIVSAAIADGRIAPASRASWLKSLDAADAIGDKSAYETLASLEKDTIPVAMRELGHAGDGSPEGVAAANGLTDELVSDWTGKLFPETRPLIAARLAASKGENPEPVERSRITADASYRR